MYQLEIKTEKLKNIYWLINLEIINPLYVNTLETYFMKNNCIFQNKKISGKSGIILHFWKSL